MSRKRQLSEIVRAAPKMTAAQRSQQRESFAYGNLHLENPRITKATVSAAARKVRPPRANK